MKPKSKEEYLKLFKEMTDLMFEIAEFDDSDGQKTEYLNTAISTWKHKNAKKTNSTPYGQPIDQSQLKHCYQCNEILTKNHQQNCLGINSLCTHCNRVGHLKRCCGRLGYFPHPPRK